MSTEAVRPSTYYRDVGNIGAKLTMDDLLALISREAKLTPRKEANEQTLAPQSGHHQKPVGAKALIGPTEASFEKAAVDTASVVTTSSRETKFDGIGTVVGIDLAGLSGRQMKRQIPSRWCMPCLASHPWADHIRPFDENIAMHNAIRAGHLPPVNPWQAFADASKASQPAPMQPEGPRVTIANFEATEEEAEILKQAIDEKGDVNGRLDCLFEFMDRKNEAIDQRRNERAHLAQRFRPHANNTATAGAFNPTTPETRRIQPTGPPPKKRKLRASGDGQQSGRANARFKR